MANAKGSSAGGTGGAGHGGDLGRAISHEQYQAFLASVHRAAAPGAANVHHHQYPAGLIQSPPMAMPAHHVPVPRPQIAVPPPPPFVRPPEHSGQSQPPTGHYQDYSPYGNTASSQYTRGFADWGTHNNALISLAHATTFGSGSNGIHQNFTSYNTHTWTATYMPRNPYNNAYGPATMNMMLQTPSFHSNSHEKDSGAGFAASSFTVSPTVVPTSPFQLMSPKSPNYTSTQIFEETNNLEDTSTVFGSGDMESDNSEEPDPTPVAEIEDQNQGNEHIVNAMSKTVNCQDYRIILRKDLTNSDVGNIGRIVLPKKDAEPNLPILEDKDGLILEMDDFELPAVWKFKYRYWPNNKSRMYILETTGEFVKRHGLQAKDILVIYKNKKSGRYVARAVKAEDIQVPECECIKAGNLSEECGFAVSPSAKKVII
ncbi:hypothetical protein SEVIR_3G017300v4 [Setaria viridis]|uniref:TF-B3 domain-containing protein n=1 Tax=Setaria viridis TaxID=4556 RepID=A0A4U6V432_SETVI|nr:putative B3 domain-containing protein Os04g0676650 [Setaria viridis]TKW23900.1 hypothetical protein SEVIR_3G017300v2 [Setaria viridis]